MAEGHATGSAEAPGELALVQRFVNTADLEDGRDDIADPDGLTSWLRANGLAGPREAFGEHDVDRVLALREALRTLLLSHHGGEADRDAVAALGAAATGAPLVVAFAPDGATRLEPAHEGVDGVLARLLAIVARAEAEGTWSRMKACPAANCHWAFYDHSRNRSRTWCEMAVCGNRAKARSYRRRAARRGDRPAAA
jgi:predicted RNA-binding Zn ribbon-like protein